MPSLSSHAFDNGSLTKYEKILLIRILQKINPSNIYVLNDAILADSVLILGR